MALARIGNGLYARQGTGKARRLPAERIPTPAQREAVAEILRTSQNSFERDCRLGAFWKSQTKEAA